jgi:hypothetical protein
MTDRGSCSRVELDGRRIVVDLSDADLAQLTATAARRGLDGSALVLGWIQHGLVNSRPWDAARDRAGRTDQTDRMARDIDVARQTDELFRDLLGDPRDPGAPD